jgi:photosystem II stability/assembly factor-like uncharacterized protein
MNRNKTCIFVAASVFVPLILAVSLVAVNRLSTGRKSSTPPQNPPQNPTSAEATSQRYLPLAQSLPLTLTAQPYPAPQQTPPAGGVTPQPTAVMLASPPADTAVPYPPPGYTAATPGPSPTRYPTPTHSQTPIPSPTRLLLPTPLPTETPLPVRIVQIRMFAANTGWAVDSNGSIQRTTHSIQSWANVSPPVAEGYKCAAASFLDVKTAIAGCIHYYLPASRNIDVITWRTTDAGQTWTNGEQITSTLDTMGLDQLEMLDSEQGWMLGIGDSNMGSSYISFFNTGDGGMHWKPVYQPTQGQSNMMKVGGYYPFPNYFAFASEMDGFYSNGDLFASADSGNSWTPFTLEPPADLPDLNCTGSYSQCKYSETISAPRFTSPQDGVLMRRVYLKTEDVEFQLSTNLSVHQLPLPEAQFLYYTHDSGQTWTPRLSPANLGTVYFLDRNTGWFLGKGDVDPNTPTQLYQTTDGGETWSLIAADCPVPLGSELQFADEKAGFAFDNYSTLQDYYSADFRSWEALTHAYLFFTTDGGRTWDKTVPQLAP